MRTIVMLDEQGGKGNRYICSKWCYEKALSPLFISFMFLFYFFLLHSLSVNFYPFRLIFVLKLCANKHRPHIKHEMNIPHQPSSRNIRIHTHTYKIISNNRIFM